MIGPAWAYWTTEKWKSVLSERLMGHQGDTTEGFPLAVDPRQSDPLCAINRLVMETGGNAPLHHLDGAILLLCDMSSSPQAQMDFLRTELLLVHISVALADLSLSGNQERLSEWLMKLVLSTAIRISTRQGDEFCSLMDVALGATAAGGLPYGDRFQDFWKDRVRDHPIQSWDAAMKRKDLIILERAFRERALRCINTPTAIDRIREMSEDVKGEVWAGPAYANKWVLELSRLVNPPHDRRIRALVNMMVPVAGQIPQWRMTDYPSLVGATT